MMKCGIVPVVTDFFVDFKQRGGFTMSIAQATDELGRARERLVLSTRLKCVLNLMETTGWPFEKAAEMLEVSLAEYERFMEMQKEKSGL